MNQRPKRYDCFALPLSYAAWKRIISRSDNEPKSLGEYTIFTLTLASGGGRIATHVAGGGYRIP